MKGNETKIAVAALLGVILLIVGAVVIFLAIDGRMPKLSQEKMQENMAESEKIRSSLLKNSQEEESDMEEEGYSKELTPFETGASDTAAKKDVQEENKKENKKEETEQAADAENEGEESAEENSEYLCAYSSDRLLTEADIEAFNNGSYENFPSGKNIIQMVINEMYARYGYQFQTGEVQAYFDGKKWYQDISVRNPDMDNVFKNMTDTEKANVEFLSAHNTEG